MPEMSEKFLEKRRRMLEDQFFAERDQLKIQALRERMVEAAVLAELKEASGIDNEDILVHLKDLGVRIDTLAALSLVPLIETAWADGVLEPREREAVLRAAKGHGVREGQPSFELLAAWLGARPARALRDAWAAYVEALCRGLPVGARRELKEDLLGRARRVAEAAGGFLGMGNKVSADERQILEELGEAFPE